MPSVIILPEGGRSPDSKIHRFRRGFLYILRQTSLDLLPITLNGFYQLKPIRRFYADPDTDLELVVHTPISADILRTLSDKEVLERAQSIIGSAYRP